MIFKIFTFHFQGKEILSSNFFIIFIEISLINLYFYLKQNRPCATNINLQVSIMNFKLGNHFSQVTSKKQIGFLNDKRVFNYLEVIPSFTLKKFIFDKMAFILNKIKIIFYFFITFASSKKTINLWKLYFLVA